MIAQLMNNSGTIIALDRTQPKVAAVQSLASDLGVTIIDARAADSTQLCPGPPVPAAAAAEAEAAAGDETAPPSAAAAPSSSSPSPSAAAAAESGAETGDDAKANTASSSGTAAAAAPATSNGSAARPALQMEGLEPESFDAVMLDAPCSALGLRPRLLHADWKLKQLHSTAGLQRALMHSAMHLLKPGGVLVYCTCTINPGWFGGVGEGVPVFGSLCCSGLFLCVLWFDGCSSVACTAHKSAAHHPHLVSLSSLSRTHLQTATYAATPTGENEGNVRFALDRWRGALQLEQQPLVLGGPGLQGDAWLTAEEAALVQRFDPGGTEDDTIGFFVARFRKTRSTLGG